MLKVKFYDTIEDSRLKFAVIISKYKGQWVFCKHRERNTYECPGGHREISENIENTAKRELWEETGAVKYSISPICVYSVVSDAGESFGMLYFADIFEFEQLPPLEMEKIELFEDLPTNWTYPLIQPLLLEQAEKIYYSK